MDIGRWALVVSLSGSLRYITVTGDESNKRVVPLSRVTLNHVRAGPAATLAWFFNPTSLEEVS